MTLFFNKHHIEKQLDNTKKILSFTFDSIQDYISIIDLEFKIINIYYVKQ